jgi:hypothetical protein
MVSRRAASRTAAVPESDDAQRRVAQFRYHLHRGRRAREAGRYGQGVAEARRALAVKANDPWALALLGQCLQCQPASDLHGARKALEQAWALDPTNGYFVSLLLDVLNAQGDSGACLDLLTWAWWRGAPVERWLPAGPLRPQTGSGTADQSAVDPETPSVPLTNAGSVHGADTLTDRLSAPAFAGSSR